MLALSAEYPQMNFLKRHFEFQFTFCCNSRVGMITLKEDDMDDHPNLFKHLHSQDHFQSRKSLK
ncbi:MAG: hypothetical protein CMM02_02485 [Rhodopirellula sp.]|nr:hypothetical protein [Rhodopirellula sp.]